MAQRFSRSIHIAAQTPLCDINKIDVQELSEVMLAEQFKDVDNNPPASSNPDKTHPYQEVFFQESMFCGHTATTTSTSADKLPKGQLRNVGNDGKIDDNGRFWRAF